MIEKFKTYFNKPVHLAPLAVFRMAFGILMFASIIRFIYRGWIDLMYIKPTFFFTYYGFEWVKPLGQTGMYIVFALLALFALFITLGLFYKFSTTGFFILFTYIELIDKTNYLNHYYFISVMSFLLILVPAHRYFSLDARLRPSIAATHAPNYFVLLIKLQVFVVYFFAGLAKVNYDWLFEAQPLRIWLPAQSEIPLIGSLLTKTWIAYFFSWFGCIYDLCIPFLLFSRRFFKIAYVFVIIFHLATSMLFNIGMFPYIMITLTTIFFSEKFHIRIIEFFKRNLKIAMMVQNKTFTPKSILVRAFVSIFILHFAIQFFLPFRYLLYPGKLFWTEQGFRFSWRVMLMEKAGTTFFYVKDNASGKESEVSNCDHLTYMQEKMMSTQPDMILQYAYYLKEEYTRKGYKDPEVRVQAYVTLNGSPSKLLVDENVDLCKQEAGLTNKSWIKEF